MNLKLQKVLSLCHPKSIPLLLIDECIYNQYDNSPRFQSMIYQFVSILPNSKYVRSVEIYFHAL